MDHVSGGVVSSLCLEIYSDDETIGLAKLEFFKNNTVKFGSSNARVPLGVAMLRQQYKKKFLVSMIEMMVRDPIGSTCR